jgi:hypothetical protein
MKKAEIGLTLGEAADKELVFSDLKTLRTSHLLITAASGGGKSYILRTIAEQLYSEIFTIIIDPEGEYSSLRERYPYLHLAKEGADAPMHPKTAAATATKLLELQASTICDLYDLDIEMQHEWVRNFVDAIMRAPKDKWRPMFIIVDEAHLFCPEDGEGESAAKRSMVNLASRGRKHGIGLIWATQRLSKLNKNAASELQNALVGRTFMHTDRERAAKVLGVPTRSAEREAFFSELKVLKPGQFYGQGVAISADRILLKAGKALTTHPEPGEHQRVAPPAPEKVKKLLPQLADIPQEVERKEKTEAELRAELKAARLELTNLQSQSKAAPMVPMVDEGAITERIAAAIASDRGELVTMFENLAKEFNDKVIATERLLSMRFAKILKIVTEELSDSERVVAASFPRLGIDRGGIMMRPLPKHTAGKGRLIAVPAAPRVVANVASVANVTNVTTPNGDLSRPQLALLRAMAEIEAIGKTEPSRTWVAFMAGVSPLSSGFEKNVGVLRVGGYITYPKDGCLSLTPQGRALAPSVSAPVDTHEMFERVKPLISVPQYALLEQLRFAWPNMVTREQLAQSAGVSALSSGFEKNVGTLCSRELATYPQKGYVRCADWLYINRD